ncbi:MAG: glucose-1-phosphate adenylyltransferase [Selenomonadales bacterium]|nr:glucose-1-phosphate adenylyltransferase [Selenomonadales bacterium]
MRGTECLAMILAGGQGSRLTLLTQNIAKPAVYFGGKYRIIDFPLSNCHNSGIDTVGVLTQYKPLALHSYIGTGEAWDLDRKGGGVFILPPYAREKDAEWYKGTADAIYQNINFIDEMDPEYVVILSGDHIYKMDYSKMLDFHKEKEAAATISVIEVPWEEASRFGIMAADETGRVTEFVEKPPVPPSNLASMGIYIFTWSFLREYLVADAADENSEHDFGKNVIPNMLNDGRRMFAYPFAGYWKDVGTVDSLWEAHMDLLSDDTELDLYDPAWRIYSVNPAKPPHYIADEAVVTTSMVSEGATVHGTVEKSVLFEGVSIGKGAIVKEAVLMPGVVIEDNARVEKAVIARGARVAAGAQVADADGKVILIGENVVVEAQPRG